MTDMEPVSMLFLQALRASLEDRTVDWETDIERETWDALFAMAASHSVLPMIYAAVVRCPAARKAGSERVAMLKEYGIIGSGRE